MKVLRTEKSNFEFLWDLCSAALRLAAIALLSISLYYCWKKVEAVEKQVIELEQKTKQQ